MTTRSSFESQIIESDETVGFNTQSDLDDEENLDDQATGSITASHFYEFTGSEWEASIEHLPYYEGNCTSERCHDGVMNSSQSDEWAIFNGHHPHDYTINKACWLRKILKFLADPLEYYVVDQHMSVILKLSNCFLKIHLSDEWVELCDC